MKTVLSLVALVACTLVATACSNSSVDTEKPKPAAAERAKPAGQPATYDPNLKPAQIVWDSPAKKRAWEARQAQIAAKSTAKTASAAK